MALTAPLKRPSHHKKVNGNHHRQSKHYLKTYHPYLPLLVLVLVGLAINLFWTVHTEAMSATTSMNSVQLLADTNAARSRGNEDPLSLDNKLSAAAQAKANDMASKGYWSHDTPSGRTPWSFMQQNGYNYYRAGENLAYGFSGSHDTIDGWLASNEHRANLLSPDFTQVGFGIATAQHYQGHGPTTIVVAMYGEPSLATNAQVVPSDPGAIVTPLRNVARVQLLTAGSASWSLLAASIISLLATAWFLVRHAKVWHRVLVQGEEFVVHHKALDILIVATAVAGFVLTRSAGFIY